MSKYDYIIVGGGIIGMSTCVATRPFETNGPYFGA